MSRCSVSGARARFCRGLYRFAMARRPTRSEASDKSACGKGGSPRTRKSLSKRYACMRQSRTVAGRYVALGGRSPSKSSSSSYRCWAKFAAGATLIGGTASGELAWKTGLRSQEEESGMFIDCGARTAGSGPDVLFGARVGGCPMFCIRWLTSLADAASIFSCRASAASFGASAGRGEGFSVRKAAVEEIGSVAKRVAVAGGWLKTIPARQTDGAAQTICAA